jgi:hypothetical protein
MSKTISNIMLCLFVATSTTFANSTYVSILRQTQTICEHQRISQDSIYKKRVFRYEISPILLALGAFENNNLPSLATGRIIYFDKFGGIIWTNTLADSSVKANDSAFVIVKTWMVTKADTTLNVLWFRRTINSWYRTK